MILYKEQYLIIAVFLDKINNVYVYARSVHTIFLYCKTGQEDQTTTSSGSNEYSSPEKLPLVVKHKNIRILADSDFRYSIKNVLKCL